MNTDRVHCLKFIKVKLYQVKSRQSVSHCTVHAVSVSHSSLSETLRQRSYTALFSLQIVTLVITLRSVLHIK